MQNHALHIKDFTTELKGLALGDFFFDNKGRKFRLYELATTLAGDEISDGDVLVLKAALIVTNDVSTGLDATNPITAGVAWCRGGDVAKSAAATPKYIPVLVDGIHDDVYIGANTVAEGDNISADPAIDRAAIAFDPSAAYDRDEQRKYLQSVFGTALEAKDPPTLKAKCLVHVKI